MLPRYVESLCDPDGNSPVELVGAFFLSKISFNKVAEKYVESGKT